MTTLWSNHRNEKLLFSGDEQMVVVTQQHHHGGGSWHFFLEKMDRAKKISFCFAASHASQHEAVSQSAQGAGCRVAAAATTEKRMPATACLRSNGQFLLVQGMRVLTLREINCLACWMARWGRLSRMACKTCIGWYGAAHTTARIFTY